MPTLTLFSFTCLAHIALLPAGNTITNMQDAGIALLESMNANIYDNVIDGVKYGIRMSLGSAGNHVHDNTFNACTDCEFLSFALL